MHRNFATEEIAMEKISDVYIELHKFKNIIEALKEMKKTMTGRIDMVDTLFYIKKIESILDEVKVEEK